MKVKALKNLMPGIDPARPDEMIPKGSVFEMPDLQAVKQIRRLLICKVEEGEKDESGALYPEPEKQEPTTKLEMGPADIIRDADKLKWRQDVFSIKITEKNVDEFSAKVQHAAARAEISLGALWEYFILEYVNKKRAHVVVKYGGFTKNVETPRVFNKKHQLVSGGETVKVVDESRGEARMFYDNYIEGGIYSNTLRAICSHSDKVSIPCSGIDI